MAYFESVFIARQDLSAQQVESLSEQMTAVVNDNGGKVEKTEQWGLRVLAYKIKKNRKGHYTQLSLDAPAAAVSELERQLGLHEDVLRSLTVRVEALDAEPSVMMQVRSGRGDRDERPRRNDRPRRDDSRSQSAPAKSAPAKSEGEK